MNVVDFVKIIESDFYVGVPDSQLKSLCNYLFDLYGDDPRHHIIAANEGNCSAIAAGYHLATGKVPVVYMQNSGQGNIINPLASLLNDKVYAIPTLFVIGWRGEPGVKDEPQHVFQGLVTLRILEDMDVAYFVLDKDTTEDDLCTVMNQFKSLFQNGKCAAIVVRKQALSYNGKPHYHNDNLLNREEIIRHIISYSQSDPVICTTGKSSRELFELREEKQQGHQYDFLTVGSMGHASSIALGIAINKPDRSIWCIDGDGAMLMHLGSIALVGKIKPRNFIHILINNESHETVGGMPTASKCVDWVELTKSCGYVYSVRVDKYQTLDEELAKVKRISGPVFIEILSSIESRVNLGRPTTTPIENKVSFMNYLN